MVESMVIGAASDHKGRHRSGLLIPLDQEAELARTWARLEPLSPTPVALLLLYTAMLSAEAAHT